MKTNEVTQSVPTTDTAHAVSGRVAARQRNHEAFLRPACLAHLPVLPLYLTVAHWGLLTGEVLTNAIISQTFHVEYRRAQEVLRYFGRYPTQVVVERLPGRATRLRVVSVMSDGRTAANEGSLQPTARLSHLNPSPGDMQAMRRWFLSRPNPAQGN